MLLLVNHKANLNLEEIIEYERKIKSLDIIIFPTISYLSLFQNGNYTLGSQDISEFEQSDKTGEINGKQLKSLNVKYTLIGHKERRIDKNETFQTLILKIKNCINNNITPLYCIGNEYEKDLNEIDEIIKIINNKEIILIYEPYENIGSDIPNLTKINNYIINIKKYIKKKYNRTIKIIYGGGININNINMIMNKNIDGIILTNSSLKIEELEQIYLKVKEI